MLHKHHFSILYNNSTVEWDRSGDSKEGGSDPGWGVFSDSSACQILTPFQGLICVHGSAQIPNSHWADWGLIWPTAAVGAYPGVRGQISPYPRETSTSENIPAGGGTTTAPSLCGELGLGHEPCQCWLIFFQVRIKSSPNCDRSSVQILHLKYGEEGGGIAHVVPTANRLTFRGRRILRKQNMFCQRCCWPYRQWQRIRSAPSCFSSCK